MTAFGLQRYSSLDPKVYILLKLYGISSGPLYDVMYVLN
jgi:hypothetical protein